MRDEPEINCLLGGEVKKMNRAERRVCSEIRDTGLPVENHANGHCSQETGNHSQSKLSFWSFIWREHKQSTALLLLHCLFHCIYVFNFSTIGFKDPQTIEQTIFAFVAWRAAKLWGGMWTRMRVQGRVHMWRSTETWKLWGRISVMGSWVDDMFGIRVVKSAPGDW